ncbi:JmjC domain-containing protein [Burkholderia sp. F1]|uniref:JmjC domain-containing protein n=1 Tax=Burkholderia sp. F1 TaxID=3366817 RepID=UPI003D7333B7
MAIEINIKISSNDFHRLYFERQFYLERNAFNCEIITWSTLSNLVHASRPDDPSDLRIFLNGPVPFIHYAQKYQDIDLIKYRLLTDRLASLLSAGATLVLNRLDLRDQSIASFCKHLSNRFGFRIVANGYLAYCGNGTFGKHWDTHDVFASQILGKKLWRVYAPTFSLPLNHQKSKNFKEDCPSDPIFESILHPGDILYIPRGWWHEAIPINNQETFHIAAGVHTAKFIDYLDWLLRARLPDTLIARTTARLEFDNQNLLTQFADILSTEILSRENQNCFSQEMEGLLNKFDKIDLTPERHCQKSNIN